MPFLRLSDRTPVLYTSLKLSRQVTGEKGESAERGEFLAVQGRAVGEVG